jgi:hypothetical protein
VKKVFETQDKYLEIAFYFMGNPRGNPRNDVFTNPKLGISEQTFLFAVMHGSIPAVTIPPPGNTPGICIFFCKNVVNFPPPGL